MKYQIYDAFVGEITNIVEAPHAGAALDEFARLGGRSDWAAALAKDGVERLADIYVIPMKFSVTMDAE